MKIAHISDLHLCSKFKKENIAKTKKIIMHALDNGADHFVFTGDISDNANQNDFLILRKILETYKLLRADKASIVIGNHDIFGGVQTAHDVLNFPSKCAKTNYKDKVKKFFEHFEELFENAFFPDDNNPFPFAKEIEDLLLIGINSIDEYSRIKNPFASNGHVLKTQRENIQKILNVNRFAEKFKVAMIHHHFFKDENEAKSSENSLWNTIENFTMKLRGKKKLLKLFKENDIGLVLHGHSHEFKNYDRKGIKFLNAGAAIDNEKDNQAGVFMIDISENKINVNLEVLDRENVFTSIISNNEVFIPSFTHQL